MTLAHWWALCAAGGAAWAFIAGVQAFRRWRGSRPDVAWAPTGIVQRFSGFDPALRDRTREKRDAEAALRRQIAAVVSAPAPEDAEPKVRAFRRKA